MSVPRVEIWRIASVSPQRHLDVTCVHVGLTATWFLLYTLRWCVLVTPVNVYRLQCHQHEILNYLFIASLTPMQPSLTPTGLYQSLTPVDLSTDQCII